MDDNKQKIKTNQERLFLPRLQKGKQLKHKQTEGRTYRRSKDRQIEVGERRGRTEDRSITHEEKQTDRRKDKQKEG